MEEGRKCRSHPEVASRPATEAPGGVAAIIDSRQELVNTLWRQSDNVYFALTR